MIEQSYPAHYGTRAVAEAHPMSRHVAKARTVAKSQEVTPLHHFERAVNDGPVGVLSRLPAETD